MTAFLVIFGFAALGLSVALLVTGARWVMRQVNADDLICDDWPAVGGWEDCL